MLIILVVDEIAFCAELEHGALKASNRWAGRSPEGPGLDALGMELMALSVTLFEIWRAGGAGDGEGDGCDGPCGCLSCMVAMVEADAEAMPCDVNAEHARDRSPSDARRRALAALSACWRSCAD